MMALHTRSMLGLALSLLAGGGIGYSALAQAKQSATAAPLQAQLTSAAPKTAVKAAAPVVAQAPIGRPQAIAQAPDGTSIRIFTLDNECQTFGSRTVVLPRNQVLEQTIKEVLAANQSPDFALAGYRVSLDNGEATLDLRLPSTSKRLFQSLALCEQQAIFGSLRRTLTANGQFGITSVRFTDRGQDLRL